MHIDSHVRHAPCAHDDSVRLSEAFGRAKTIFDQGESLWIPVMVLGLG